MIYKTIITDARIHSLNDAHKVIHRVMHTPDEHKPCPAYMIAGPGAIIVQSDYRPASKTAIVAEVSMDGCTEVHLRVMVAAVRRDKNGVEKAALIDNKVDTEYMSAYVTKRFAEFGLTPNGKVKVSYVGKASEPGHNMKECPVCEIDGNWKAESSSQLEHLLVTKIGRRKFLGLGMVRVVSEC